MAFKSAPSQSCLGMYDVQEIQQYTDCWWNSISKETNNFGIKTPGFLTRDRSFLLSDAGENGKLFLGQTCGWPVLFYPKSYKIVGIPKYNTNGCTNHNFRSVIITNNNNKITDLTQLEGGILAVNSRFSLSGCLLLAATVGKDIMASLSILPTGAHEKSIECVSSGRASVAAIDCVTYGLLAKHKPHILEDIQIIGYTVDAPALPYITSYNSSSEFVKSLQEALRRSVESTESSVVESREQLLIGGMHFFENSVEGYDYYAATIRRLQNLASSPSAEVLPNYRTVFKNVHQYQTVNSELSCRLSEKDTIQFLHDKMAGDAAYIETLITAMRFEYQNATDKNSDKPLSRWDELKGSLREHRNVFPGGFQSAGDFFLPKEDEEENHVDVVCFLGERIRVFNCLEDDHDLCRICWEIDGEIVRNLDPSIVVAYSTTELEAGGEWGNVVMFKKGKSADDFVHQMYSTHSAAIHRVAPLYYKRLRIHRGSMDLTSGSVQIDRTIYISYERVDTSTSATAPSTELKSANDTWNEVEMYKLSDKQRDRLAVTKTNRHVFQWNQLPPTVDIFLYRIDGILEPVNPLDINEHLYKSDNKSVFSAESESVIESCNDLVHNRYPEGFYYEDENETVFDSSKHLYRPEIVTDEDKICPTSLSSLGYEQSYLENLPSNVAITNTFRVLTDEGIAALRHSLKVIDKHALSSPRIPKVLRGPAFRSRYIADLAKSVELTKMASHVAGCALLPHPMTIMHGHTNLLVPIGSERRKESVDKWHYDTVAFVLIIFVSDTKLYDGGQFQYYAGTIQEAESFMKEGHSLPEDKIKTVGVQHPGYAVFAQGRQVYHRAAKAEANSIERTTVVMSYVAANVMCTDACYYLSRSYNQADPLVLFIPEWARLRSWKAQRYLLYWLRTMQRGLAARTGVSVIDKSANDVGIEVKNALTVLSIAGVNEELILAVLESRERLLRVIKTLPYTLDRLKMYAELMFAIEPLITFLKSNGVHIDENSIIFDLESDVQLKGHNNNINNCICAAIQTVINAGRDVLTLKEGKADMVYFK